MKVAAVADLHCRTGGASEISGLLEGVERQADVLVLAGDLTNRGMSQEMEALLAALQPLKLPVVAVLGNHDHESDQAELLVNMLQSSAVCVLENETCVINDIGFIGAKGFCGGFDERRIQPFGEQAIKAFVQAGVSEALRIEAGLKKLEGRRGIGVLHYAPIRATLQGESLELFPFLGSSLIESAFDRYQKTDVIFHGHAHHGKPAGRTKRGIPVYNVSRFVRTAAGESPYLIYEI